MQLPEFTHDQIERWTKAFNKSNKSAELTIIKEKVNSGPLFRKMLGHINIDHMRESFFCAQWMSEHFEKLPYNPFTDDEINRLCFAFGQRSFHYKKEELKLLAVTCLEKFISGYREPEPAVLGPQIFREHAGRLGLKV